MKSPNRCKWASDDPIYQDYHDNEWGVPLRDSQNLFELLCLEGQQAGLSWITILKRRESYREAFDGFNPELIVNYDQKKIDELLKNEGIIRYELKIKAIIKNAHAYLAMLDRGENFSDFLWNFVDGKPILNQFETHSEIPAQTDLSVKISKELKKRGFTFVGPTIVYAFMQASGMVNDHTSNCDCYKNN